MLTHRPSGKGDQNVAPYAFNAPNKQNGFNLDAVDVKIAKPLDEGKWSAGYTAEAMLGDEGRAALGSWYPIREAYVSLRANVGNGLDFKLGEWDNILGFESTDAMNNPNWTRSYGYTIEPTEHIGVLAMYPFSSSVNLQVGIADELTAGVDRNLDKTVWSAPITANPAPNPERKAIVSLLTLTAPDSWGAVKGSRLYVGADYGPGNGVKAGITDIDHSNGRIGNKTELYAGATIMTPVKGLSFGLAFDNIDNADMPLSSGTSSKIQEYEHLDTSTLTKDGYSIAGFAQSLAAYVSYQIPDTKLTLNTRAEYAHGSAFENLVPDPDLSPRILAFTETIEYKLWGDNVITRLEGRWDHAEDGNKIFGGTTDGSPISRNSFLVAANVIYKF